MIKGAIQRTIRVVNGAAIFFPSETRDVVRIIQSFEQIEDQLFAVAAAHEIHLWTLLLDEFGVQRGKHAAKGQADTGIGGANLTGEDLGVRVTRRAQKTQPDQVGLLSANLVNNDLIRCLRIGLVKHHALVPGAFDHRGERHDPDRRETHHPYIAVLGAGRRR